jgi:hypothetical protein
MLSKFYIIHQRDVLWREEVGRRQSELLPWRNLQRHQSQQVNHIFMVVLQQLTILYDITSITLQPPTQLAPATYSCANVKVIGNDASLFNC